MTSFRFDLHSRRETTPRLAFMTKHLLDLDLVCQVLLNFFVENVAVEVAGVCRRDVVPGMSRSLDRRDLLKVFLRKFDLLQVLDDAL